MSNWRETKEQTEKKTTVVKMNPVSVIQTRNTEGVIQFSSYNLETKESKLLPDELIKGVLVGSYFKAEQYSQAFNCSVSSTPYFQKTNICRIFCTDKHSPLNEKVKYFVATADEAKATIKYHAGDVKVVAVIVLATKDGVIEIKTNPSIYLAQYPRIAKSTGDYLVYFRPKRYNPEDKNEGLNEAYKDMEEKYYPLYATMSLSNEPIVPILEKDYKLDEVFKLFKEFKEFIVKGEVRNANAQAFASTTSNTASPTPNNQTRPAAPMAADLPSFDANSGNDDLPF